MTLGVTVLICTYNGSKRLPDTLAYLARQVVHERIDWEVLIVDNASTDNSAETALSAWKKLGEPVPLRITNQPIPGLTPAKEKGLCEAKYEYVIICDDDNWLNPDFINRSYQLMNKNPDIGILGGYGELVFEEDPPTWLEAYCIYASGPQAKKSGKVSHHKVYGAGSVIRRSAYQFILKAGFNSLLSDRMAAQLTSGGDHEFCYAMVLAGYDIWYDEELKFKHFIAKDRISWEHYMRYIRESATCFEVLEPYKILVNSPDPQEATLMPELARSFFYHLRKLLPTWWSYQLEKPRSRTYYANLIQHILLRTRLQSYYLPNGLKQLKLNFQKVKEYHKSLLKNIGQPVN